MAGWSSWATATFTLWRDSLGLMLSSTVRTSAPTWSASSLRKSSNFLIVSIWYILDEYQIWLCSVGHQFDLCAISMLKSLLCVTANGRDQWIGLNNKDAEFRWTDGSFLVSLFSRDGHTCRQLQTLIHFALQSCLIRTSRTGGPIREIQSQRRTVW